MTELTVAGPPSARASNVDAFNVTVLAISAYLFERFPVPAHVSAAGVWEQVVIEQAHTKLGRAGRQLTPQQVDHVLEMARPGLDTRRGGASDWVGPYLQSLIDNLRKYGTASAIETDLRSLHADWTDRLDPLFDSTLDFLVAEGFVRWSAADSAAGHRLTARAMTAMLVSPRQPESVLGSGSVSSPASSLGAQLLESRATLAQGVGTGLLGEATKYVGETVGHMLRAFVWGSSGPA